MPRIKRVFTGILSQADLLAAATSAAISTTLFTEIGSYEILYGRALMLGAGQQSGQDNAVGRVYMSLMNGATQLAGVVQLQLFDVLGRPQGVLKEWRTEQLLTSATVPAQQIPLPVMDPKIQYKRTVRLMFKGDAATAVVKANSTILVGVTHLELEG